MQKVTSIVPFGSALNPNTLVGQGQETLPPDSVHKRESHEINSQGGSRRASTRRRRKLTFTVCHRSMFHRARPSCASGHCPWSAIHRQYVCSRSLSRQRANRWGCMVSADSLICPTIFSPAFDIHQRARLAKFTPNPRFSLRSRYSRTCHRSDESA